MARNHNKCSHLDNIIQHSLSEICKMKQGCSCSECDTRGPNLWICLQKTCLHIGCSEQANDHSTEHFKLNQPHCIHMNLSSQRVWCYLCETEVFFSQRRNSLMNSCSNNFNLSNINTSDPSRFFERMYDRAPESPESSYDEDDGDRRNMDGLVGLQNIANTCYMNAALQALSNSPPLLSYFLQCGDLIEAASELSGNQRKPGLAKSYHRLIKTMWCRNKRSNGYVVPRDILARIRNVHPMFRGFQQHDTQEFLRCFMDQLHEELKEVTPPLPEYTYNKSNSDLMAIDNEDDQSPCSTPSPSQSEAEYETCDSGVSERSSLSDELQMSSRRNDNQSTHSASPNLCQRSLPLSKSSSYNNTSSQAPNSGQQGQQRERSPPKRPHRSIISDIFDGKLLSSVQCLTCNRVSTREETFQDLSLPIPGKDHLAVLHQSQGIVVNMAQQQQPGVTCTDVVYQAGQDGWFWWIWNWLRSWFWGPAVSLYDCMAAFFSADELKGDNMYSCEKCHKLRNGIKYSRVLALPEMLCIHLKRFRHDLSYSSKISSPVNFPLTGLDMRPYLHKDCKSEVSTYDLTAVICHHGTVGGGHYTSFAKHDLTGKWFEFDDQLVTEVGPEIVQNCQAYVLFYRKSNPKMSIIRAHAKELAESNPPQSDLQFYISKQWINRFNTFAEPGPIDNYSILCPHGGLPPCKAALSAKLAIPIQQPLWDFLYKNFGGGPICNRLFECDTCRRSAELLARRQEAELEAFTKFKDEFQNENTPTTIYAISMVWFRQWQLFAEGKINEEPGPINNAPIALTTENSSTTSVRPGSDYAQLNKKLWKFFHGIYGGGPEIILRGGPAEEDSPVQVQREEIMEIDEEHLNEDVIEIENQIIDIPKDTDVNNGRAVSPSTVLTANSNGQLKTSKNVSFEDEVVDDNDENDEIHLNKFDLYNGMREQKRYSSRHRRIDEDIDKFCREYELKDSFGLEGKYQKQNQIQSNHIPDLSTTQPITLYNNHETTIPQQQQQQPSSIFTNNNSSSSITSTPISPNTTDPCSDLSQNVSNCHPKSGPILNPQITTVIPTTSAATVSTTAVKQHSASETICSSVKRKFAELTPLINYQPFQASATTTKVELKSYRKVDAISPQQQQSMTPSSGAIDSKVIVGEIPQNAEQQQQQQPQQQQRQQQKSKTSSRRRNKIRRSSKSMKTNYLSDPNNSDSG